MLPAVELILDSVHFFLAAATIVLQRATRCLLARRELERRRRRWRAAISLQTVFRGHVAHRRFLELKSKVIPLQAICRGARIRSEMKQLGTS